MIDVAKLNRLQRAVSLVGLIAKYTELTRVGWQYVGLCPFHEDVNPSLCIEEVKGVYFCSGCGAAGDAVQFLQQIEGIDLEQAVARLEAAVHRAERF
ncbi:MAG TPA: CHC2 zinc finger domain-containing protein [Polyangiaceae bacterium]|nr:CHC2 zinc finger domain-containing protein [Polyangiaceae bacterium]